jgi:hypothetical protein
VQRHSDPPGAALGVFEANTTIEDETRHLQVRWGYAAQGIRATMLLEAVDERPRGRRTGFPRKKPLTAIVLLLGLVCGGAMEMFFLGQLVALVRMRLLLL